MTDGFEWEKRSSLGKANRQQRKRCIVCGKSFVTRILGRATCNERCRAVCQYQRDCLKDSSRNRFRINSNRRRARLAGGGTHTVADIQNQLKRQRGRCYYAACGHVKLGDKYHVEHVVPLSRNGWNDPSNIVISCPSCNLRKQDKLPHEWPEGGRLL